MIATTEPTIAANAGPRFVPALPVTVGGLFDTVAGTVPVMFGCSVGGPIGTGATPLAPFPGAVGFGGCAGSGLTGGGLPLPGLGGETGGLPPAGGEPPLPGTGEGMGGTPPGGGEPPLPGGGGEAGGFAPPGAGSVIDIGGCPAGVVTVTIPDGPGGPGG